jgi:hypothetical protein
MPSNLFELADKRIKPMARSGEIIASPHLTKTELIRGLLVMAERRQRVIDGSYPAADLIVRSHG